MVHGSLSVYRLSRLIKYSFYKNIAFAFLLAFYQIYCGFSGECPAAKASETACLNPACSVYCGCLRGAAAYYDGADVGYRAQPQCLSPSAIGIQWEALGP